MSTPKELPARCRWCGSTRCHKPQSAACDDARNKRLGDE